MSTATAPRPAKTPPYRVEKEFKTKPCPPERYAEVGMVVQHYNDPRTKDPTCAVVTKIGMETLDCNIIHPALGTMVPFSGVHHADYQTDRIDSEGAWRPLALNVAILKFMIAEGALVWCGETSRYISPTPGPDLPATPDEKPEEKKKTDPIA